MAIDQAARWVANAVAEAVAGVVGGRLLGLIVYGSAVTGGFDSRISDVDMIAVTAVDAAELDLAALKAAHEHVLAVDRAWTDRIEIVYVGQRALERFRDERGALAVISPGEPLHVSGPVRDWLQNWYLARQTGVAIVGPAPADLLPRISRDEFLSGVRWYAGYLAGFVDGERSPGELAYAVLSACRAARTIDSGVGCSKQDGAAWLRARRPELAAVIDEALATREARGRHGFEDPVLVATGRALVRDIAVEVTGPKQTTL